MSDSKKSKPIIKALDILAESVSFIVISYLLINAMYAFKNSVVWVLFLATNAWLVQKYWKALHAVLERRILCFAVFTASLLVLAGIGFFVGYLPMDALPIKLF